MKSQTLKAQRSKIVRLKGLFVPLRKGDVRIQLRMSLKWASKRLELYWCDVVCGTKLPAFGDFLTNGIMKFHF